MSDRMLPDIEVARYALRTFRPRLQNDYTWGLGSLGFEGSFWDGGVCKAECYNSSFTNNIGVTAWVPRSNRRENNYYSFWILNRPEKNPEQHPAPHLSCHCGIYGTLTLTHLTNQYQVFASRIITVIAAEGTTILGDRGLRTEYARVVSWWCCGDPELVAMCQHQFPHAEAHTDINQMLRKYGLS